MDHPPPTHGHGQPSGGVVWCPVRRFVQWRGTYVPAGYMGAWRVAHADCQGGHVHLRMRLCVRFMVRSSVPAVLRCPVGVPDMTRTASVGARSGGTASLVLHVPWPQVNTRRIIRG